MKCSSESTVCAMSKSIRTVLSPLLIISYASGLRIIEFPIGHPREWFSFLYISLFWLIYYFLFKSVMTLFYTNKHYTTEFLIGILIDILTTLISIIFGVYYNKKFRNCLRKLNVIDNTLLNIGTKTDYHKLHKIIICLILGWLLLILLMSYGVAYWLKTEFDYEIYMTTYSIFIRNYCSYINMINDLLIASILGYIGLKFDEVNQHLLNLIRNNKSGSQLIWEISMHKSPQSLNNEWITWIVIHLHSELREISCEIDSIFGAQMTFKMGCNFYWLAIDLRELFSVILLTDHIATNKTLYTIISLIWLCHNMLKLFFINYVCETVSIKANAAGNLIKKMSYSTCDVKIRENISVFLLQLTQAPVRFYGIGLFQFGYKFLYGFSSSITTVVVLSIQAIANKQTF